MAEVYGAAAQLLLLPAVRRLLVVLITCRVAFAASGAPPPAYTLHPKPETRNRKNPGSRIVFLLFCESSRAWVCGHSVA